LFLSCFLVFLFFIFYTWNHVPTYRKTAHESPCICFAAALQPNWGLGRLFVEVYRSRTINTLTQYDSTERVISSSQRPLPNQNTTNTTYEHLYPQKDLNPRSQQSSGCRPTL
jgi:hypothetical protein